MLELLVAVVALQYLTVVAPVKADAVWLAGDYIGAPNAELCVEDPAATTQAPCQETHGTTGP
jgi:hypothetical protein